MVVRCQSRQFNSRTHTSGQGQVTCTGHGTVRIGSRFVTHSGFRATSDSKKHNAGVSADISDSRQVVLPGLASVSRVTWPGAGRVSAAPLSLSRGQGWRARSDREVLSPGPPAGRQADRRRSSDNERHHSTASHGFRRMEPQTPSVR